MTLKAILSRKGDAVVTVRPTTTGRDALNILDENRIGADRTRFANISRPLEPDGSAGHQHPWRTYRPRKRPSCGSERARRSEVNVQPGATAMRKLVYKLGLAIGLALFSSAAFADTQEDVELILSKVAIYGLIAFVVIVVAVVYLTRSLDKRRTPLNRLFEQGETIHAAGPDMPVSECVRKMTAEKIGALVIMEGARLAGIFTERDALTRVLAAGLDPSNTKVSAVMTRDPLYIPPTTTVAEAMQLVTQRRFRHLPVVENGKVIAVISSGDLTHWLVQDKLGDVKELVELGARSYERMPRAT